MEKILWSVDDQQYDDRNGHILLLEGWYVDPAGKDYRFVLYCDNKTVIELPPPKRYDRPDVVRELEKIPGITKPGFTAAISNVLELTDKYNMLELFLVHGKEKVSIWKMMTMDLREFCEDRLIEYHIDKEEILYKTTLCAEGWVLNQRGGDELLVEDSAGRPVKCQLKRGTRPDVVEGRQLEDSFRTREIGFRLTVNMKDVPGKKVILRFRGKDTDKCHVIDMKKLRAEQSPMAQRVKALSWDNKDRNLEYIRKNGLKEFGRFIAAQADAASGDYEQWLARHSVTRLEAHRQRKSVFPYSPLISIVIPVYNTPLHFFRELMDSIRAQTYTNWQLCLADGSDGDEIREFLKKYYRKEKRITYKKLKENKGISQNTNSAVELAKGDFILLCDHDDVLTPDALFEIVLAINKHHHVDVVYTDEDKVSMDGKHYFEPNFKPDFNLFRLRENNYICHIFVVKKELLYKAGLFCSEFDGAQDFDLILRCCEQAQKIVHVPKVLYHWRCHMDSTAADPGSKAYAYEAGRKAVQEHYNRLGIRARVECCENPGWYRSHVEIVGQPLISILIPNKDHTEDLELCLSSIYQKSTYPRFQVLIVENNSQCRETFAYYETLPEKYPGTQVLTWTKEFNYAAINNFAAEQAQGEYLLFLNNDVEILTPSWMEEMLSICQQDQVGIVGAKLFYPDDTIQHAGVVIGLGGIAGHIMCKALGSEPGYMGRLVSVQEISAVTAACMMVKTAVFRQAKGFDESFQVAFNDIDLCMKVRDMKKQVVFTPYAQLYHYESKSRGMEDTPEKQCRFAKEVRRFQTKWNKELSKVDPYYSPNLSLKEGNCSLSED